MIKYVDDNTKLVKTNIIMNTKHVEQILKY